jgi:4-hydroxy-tetrahydrodipicolinate synthase
MSETVRLHGVIPANILPFAGDLRIDFRSLERVLAYMTAPEGVTAIVCNGHAGETASLSPGERAEVIRSVVRQIGPSRPVIAGVFAQSTADAIEQVREARRSGARAALIFPPTVFAGGANRLPEVPVRFFRDIAAATDCPLVVFQYPPAGGWGYSPETLARICEIPQVIGIKEGSGDLVAYEDNLRTVRAARPDVAILPSNFHWFLAQVAIGADGILSGLASLTPQWFCDLWAATQAGDLARAQKLNDDIYPIVRVVYGAPPLLDMHTRIKVALKHLGLIATDLPRRPLLPIAPEEAKRICRVVEEAGLLGAGARA